MIFMTFEDIQLTANNPVKFYLNPVKQQDSPRLTLFNPVKRPCQILSEQPGVIYIK